MAIFYYSECCSSEACPFSHRFTTFPPLIMAQRGSSRPICPIAPRTTLPVSPVTRPVAKKARSRGRRLFAKSVSDTEQRYSARFLDSFFYFLVVLIDTTNQLWYCIFLTHLLPYFSVVLVLPALKARSMVASVFTTCSPKNAISHSSTSDILIGRQDGLSGISDLCKECSHPRINQGFCDSQVTLRDLGMGG